MTEQELRDQIIQKTVEQMATALLETENKKLDKIFQFLPDRLPWPPGITFLHARNIYYLLTPDGYAEILPGDYIVQTLNNERYFLRLDIKE